MVKNTSNFFKKALQFYRVIQESLNLGKILQEVNYGIQRFVYGVRA